LKINQHFILIFFWEIVNAVCCLKIHHQKCNHYFKIQHHNCKTTSKSIITISKSSFHRFHLFIFSKNFMHRIFGEIFHFLHHIQLSFNVEPSKTSKIHNEIIHHEFLHRFSENLFTDNAWISYFLKSFYPLSFRSKLRKSAFSSFKIYTSSHWQYSKYHFNSQVT
jgi:hypothetical protein